MKLFPRTTAARMLIAMTAAALAASSLSPPPGAAEGGKWAPDQLLDFDPAELRAQGLELPAAELWDAAAGGGLLAATVNLSGCTGSLVSPRGLVLTNHHCITGVLQSHSAPDQEGARRDLIRHGFLAAAADEELPATAVRVQLPHRFTDVSREIEAAVPAGAGDHERFRAIDRKKKELVASCEAQGAAWRCQVAAFDDGVRYLLVEMREYPDVRLVWAPPTAVANFGGEVDNFSWPRHSGDAALLRVWARPDGSPAERQPGNVPLSPERFFRLSAAGAADGAFVMVAGYPARTYRSTVHAEMAEWAELFFPQRAALYRDFIDILEAESRQGEEVRLRLVSRIRELANREKAARGQVEGIARGRLLAKKLEREEAFRAWAAARPEEAPALQALDALKARAAGRPRGDWQREYLLSEARAASRSLQMALAVTRWALEREKSDAERTELYQQRNFPRARDEQKRDQGTLHPPVEKVLLADYLERLLALPEGSRVAAVESRFRAGAGTPEGRAAMVAAIGGWLAGTRLHDEAERLKMLEESSAQLRARRDPYLDFAFDLNAQILAAEADKEAREGASSRERPLYRRALARFLGRPLDADANATLRVSLARIAGYAPRDGLFATPRTTFSGLLAKDSGLPPFDLPEELAALAAEARASRYADPQRGDLPVDFLADADTTGGNSGSPVLDGRGRVIGLNFDRVWENVANDFGYDPAVARNVSVDIRYVLFLLERLAGPKKAAAEALLDELGVR